MSAFLFSGADAARLLPPRPADSHKGKNGRLLLLLGSERYTGAALLCAAAALRAGAGLCSAAVPRAIKPAFAALPEVCCLPVGEGGRWDGRALAEAAALLPGQDALAMGCGMGECDSPALLLAALHTQKPLVIDADGLNLLAKHRDILEHGLHGRVILTPHPGEMARLMACSTAELTEDAAATARQAARAWGCVVLLKGAESHIAFGGRLAKNTSGNSGLAKGGSGDVLTGLIAGLLAQGLESFDAACLGAYLLGVSADQAFRLLGERMLIARDVIDVVAETIQTIDGE